MWTISIALALVVLIVSAPVLGGLGALNAAPPWMRAVPLLLSALGAAAFGARYPHFWWVPFVGIVASFIVAPHGSAAGRATYASLLLFGVVALFFAFLGAALSPLFARFEPAGEPDQMDARASGRKIYEVSSRASMASLGAFVGFVGLGFEFGSVASLFGGNNDSAASVILCLVGLIPLWFAFMLLARWPFRVVLEPYGAVQLSMVLRSKQFPVRGITSLKFTTARLSLEGADPRQLRINYQQGHATVPWFDEVDDLVAELRFRNRAIGPQPVPEAAAR